MISLVRGLFHLSSRRSTAKSVITRAHAGATKFNKKEKKAFEEKKDAAAAFANNAIALVEEDSLPVCPFR